MRVTSNTRSQPDFYPRSPCGERPFYPPKKTLEIGISIHALLAESDHKTQRSASSLPSFLSTLSLRRATREPTALRTPHHNFYPRSPCGERRVSAKGISSKTAISIHALLAESDASQTNLPSKTSDFYPRSPCGERPSIKPLISKIFTNFYPRSPCGERRGHDLGRRVGQRFLSTLSLRRATLGRAVVV